MKMMVRVFALFLALSCLTSLVAQEAERTSQNDPRLKKWLQRWPQADADGDGVLTMEEARAARERVQAQKAGKELPHIAATESDVAYGPHERHVFDFWKAESEKPTPTEHRAPGGYAGVRFAEEDESWWYCRIEPHCRCAPIPLTLRRRLR